MGMGQLWRREEDEGSKKVPEDRKKLPAHMEIILGGLSRIIESSLLLPLDVVRVRLLYPDTWYVSMFREMVQCGGCPLPSKNMSANMLQKRTYSSLKLGTYYCVYEAHRRNCGIKNVATLWHGEYLLKARPVVAKVPQIGTFAQARDYALEKKKLQEHNVLRAVFITIGGYVVTFGAAVFSTVIQNWPFDRLTTSIIATTLLHPLDVIKVRLQLYPETWGVSLFTQMLRGEGIRAPYTGLTAGILRQTTYTTSKLGTYYCLYEYHKNMYNKMPSFSEKLAIGVYAGLVGAVVGCPAEIVLVRMMADGPVDPYRRYRGLAHAFSKIWREEGFLTLWRGGLLTMSRSVVISVAQIGTYAQAREFLMEKKTKGFLLHLYTSMMSSLVTALATLPLDTFKTRYQVASKASHVDVYYRFQSCCGPMGFWRGFTPYYIRLTIHTLLTFYLLEMMYDLHNKAPRKSSIL